MAEKEENGIFRDKSDFFAKLNENYEGIVPINEGGGGIIYAGIHRRLGQKVVLKKIRTNRIGVIGAEREMQILMNLKHTYLPRILDFWSYGDEVYTVMEFIEGKSLKELLDAGVTFTEKEVVKMTRQLSEVMVYLHESPDHIVHSDIKPANIMLTPEGNICLIDFNVSQNEDEDESIGYTPGYAPVEQLISAERGRQKRLRARLLAGEGSVAPLQSQPMSAEGGNGVGGDDRTVLDDDRTVLDGDRTVLDDDRTVLDEDRTTLHEDAPVRASSAKSPEAAAPQRVQTAAPAAMPPPPPYAEQAAAMAKKYGADAKVDPRTDIYSACATMYHLLTGKKPAPCYEKQVPISRLVPTVGDAFEKLLTHGMEQAPDKRFATSRQLLKAVTGLAKSSRRYKRMRTGQDLCVVLLCIVMAAGAVSTYLGGTKLLENKIDGILSNASMLYAQGEYASAEATLYEEILRSPYPVSEEREADAYHVIGNCRLQTEDLTGAIEAYRTAVMLGDDAPELYRDYGIALARGGQPGQAAECLAQAEAKGLSADSLLLLRGEIAAANGQTAEAEAAYRACLTDAMDAGVRMRAGLRLDTLLESLGDQTRTHYDDRIADLQALAGDFSDNKGLRLPVLQRLAQVYIDADAACDDPAYIEGAVAALDTVIADGYGTLSESLTRAVCLQSIGAFDRAKEGLLAAEQKYSGSYLLYKRLAFLEIEIQYARDLDARDYGAFKTYYDTCTALYAKETHTEEDIEMAYLEKTYGEVVALGWLDP